MTTNSNRHRHRRPFTSDTRFELSSAADRTAELERLDGWIATYAHRSTAFARRWHRYATARRRKVSGWVIGAPVAR